MRASRGSRRYWLNLIGFTFVIAVLGYFAFTYLGVSYYMARGFTQPQRARLLYEPGRAGLRL
jgi:hypothetical protein